MMMPFIVKALMEKHSKASAGRIDCTRIATA